jgi:hypothetical protein
VTYADHAQSSLSIYFDECEGEITIAACRRDPRGSKKHPDSHTLWIHAGLSPWISLYLRTAQLEEIYAAIGKELADCRAAKEGPS